MTSRKLFVSILACMLAVGFLGIAPGTDVAWAGKSVRKSGEGARNYALEMRRRGRAPVIHLPLGPSYIYYDYPYYYSRGHYPTHIVHYVYHPSLFQGRRYYHDFGSPRRKARN